MPIYEYQCQSCGRRSEVMQKLADPPLDTCTVCSGPLKKLISAPAFQFKGSGWYVTDYAKKGGGDKADKSEKGERGEKGDSGAAEGGKESKETKETKADGGKETKPAKESASSGSGSAATGKGSSGGD